MGARSRGFGRKQLGPNPIGPGPLAQDRLRYRIRVSAARTGPPVMHIHMAIAARACLLLVRIAFEYRWGRSALSNKNLMDGAADDGADARNPLLRLHFNGPYSDLPAYYGSVPPPVED